MGQAHYAVPRTGSQMAPYYLRSRRTRSSTLGGVDQGTGSTKRNAERAALRRTQRRVNRRFGAQSGVRAAARNDCQLKITAPEAFISPESRARSCEGTRLPQKLFALIAKESHARQSRSIHWPRRIDLGRRGGAPVTV
jgi:hypothetical protein